MGLIEALGDGPVALDAAIFIYFIEEHPRYLPSLVPVFEAIDGGSLTAVTSAVTLLEVLVVPYRAKNRALAERYEALLRRSRGLTLVELALSQLRFAAQLRAEIGLRTPDALQVAAALSAHCSTLLTNDRRLPEKVGGMRVLQLGDFVAG